MAIRLKRKNTSGYTWQSSDLVEGQVGLNIADGTLHFKKSDNSVVNLATGTLPDQTGQAGQFLQTNGTTTDWVSGSNNIEFLDSTGASKPISLSGITSGNALELATSLTFGTSAEVFTGSGNYGWRDITSDISVKGTGTNNPSWATVRNGISAYTFSATTMQEAWVNFHINHDYAVGTPIYLHVHWINPGTNTGTVRWGFEYTIAKGHQQEAFPATTTAYVEQASSGQFVHMIGEISSGISSASLEPDALILVRVFRDAAHVNDTCTNAVALVMSDVHYQANKWATKNKAPNFNL
jgi:hypothetical protein